MVIREALLHAANIWSRLRTAAMAPPPPADSHLSLPSASCREWCDGPSTTSVSWGRKCRWPTCQNCSQCLGAAGSCRFSPPEQGLPLLFSTYSGSRLDLRDKSSTYRKLVEISDALAVARRAGPGYRLELLYQKGGNADHFRCAVHKPPGVEQCYEFSRGDLKRAFGKTLASAFRLNIGFWLCALWLMQEEAAGRCHAFVWYAEDDVMLTGPWHEFMQAQDAALPAVDLLAAQEPYLLAPPDLPWTSKTELSIARGDVPLPPDANRQLLYPTSNMHVHLLLANNRSYAKVPLYMWRISGRLSASLARHLARGLRVHEEFLVPTVCLATLTAPPCRMQAVPAPARGVPLGANLEDAWLNAQRSAQPHGDLAVAANNRTEFQRLFARLQQGGGASLLPKGRSRLYHPVKGQLGRPKGALGLG